VSGTLAEIDNAAQRFFDFRGAIPSGGDSRIAGKHRPEEVQETLTVQRAFDLSSFLLGDWLNLRWDLG
jgi:hypothetical protein